MGKAPQVQAGSETSQPKTKPKIKPKPQPQRPGNSSC